jgi:hypothetical protein
MFDEIFQLKNVSNFFKFDEIFLLKNGNNSFKQP